MSPSLPAAVCRYLPTSFSYSSAPTSLTMHFTHLSPSLAVQCSAPIFLLLSPCSAVHPSFFFSHHTVQSTHLSSSLTMQCSAPIFLLPSPCSAVHPSFYFSHHAVQSTHLSSSLTMQCRAPTAPPLSPCSAVHPPLTLAKFYSVIEGQFVPLPSILPVSLSF